MERFNELAKLYQDVLTAMSAICVAKGGLDIGNYSGRFFAADLLEFIVGYGEKLKVDVSELRKELDSKKDFLTPSNKPIYEMTLAEFERVFGVEETSQETRDKWSRG
jgi:hypothetical protein